ncbi:MULTISPECIES: ATP-binding protein [Rhodococcus]|uniref:ATP-binding protein n=1 Tax=Rhodococcus oxybenzonivorans TaxID=1990687 RepID=A0AAE5A958_9NOCA|nr:MULTISPECIES: ATP-binding protein [Rhodococcus]MDV7245354.1 ATP-binding protein [Rhodococcus oxybenzonivorans]MDV7267848.1 ATP-binding protein [Rhodococcus oxybenzonivorans]MDV7272366.1 ATP-binding protein [Rhodococcus oxybenzonivorans]MDV7336379.1 ATP-binding protein [Rhodococcus oxybenzonivorans]MDV7347679.1 ATP-binding protein [Rhodococcus oxybenzonivorans]
MSVRRPHLGISAAQDHYGQTRISGAPVDPGQPALSFEAFTGEVLAWVQWWNTEHSIGELGDRTPMQSWDGDPTPIHDADETRLWMFTLEDDRRNRKITTKGDAFGRNRYYIAEWMVGLVGAGVRIRLFRARPTPRDIRHTLFDALAIGGAPPLEPIEFDRLLKDVLSERFRVLVCDEAQWMSRECHDARVCTPAGPRVYPACSVGSESGESGLVLLRWDRRLQEGCPDGVRAGFRWQGPLAISQLTRQHVL